jgi:hypothetical protein
MRVFVSQPAKRMSAMSEDASAIRPRNECFTVSEWSISWKEKRECDLLENQCKFDRGANAG